MVYLHVKQVDDRLERHWANESESDDDEVATYKILQKETNQIYDDAIDVVQCRYTYEATDMKIENEEPKEPEENE